MREERRLPRRKRIDESPPPPKRWKPKGGWGPWIVAGLVLAVGLSVVVGSQAEEQEAATESRPSAATIKTEKARPFRTSINRHLEAGDLQAAVFSCDLAEISLAKSRSNDEIRDWLAMVPACNAAAAGNLAEARRLLPN